MERPKRKRLRRSLKANEQYNYRYILLNLKPDIKIMGNINTIVIWQTAIMVLYAVFFVAIAYTWWLLIRALKKYLREK
jgi:hypothetical protein